MRYRVSLKKKIMEKTVNASCELEAKVKYCEQKGFNYRVYAPMLEAERKGKTI